MSSAVTLPSSPDLVRYPAPLRYVGDLEASWPLPVKGGNARLCPGARAVCLSVAGVPCV